MASCNSKSPSNSPASLRTTIYLHSLHQCILQPLFLVVIKTNSLCMLSHWSVPRNQMNEKPFLFLLLSLYICISFLLNMMIFIVDLLDIYSNRSLNTIHNIRDLLSEFHVICYSPITSSTWKISLLFFGLILQYLHLKENFLIPLSFKQVCCDLVCKFSTY